MTVMRTELVQWWPLVDIAKLGELKPGDTFILRLVKPMQQDDLAKMCGQVARVCPAGVEVLVFNGEELEIGFRRAMREMRAEDLEIPERPKTMEA